MSNQMLVTDTQKVFQIDCDTDITVPEDSSEYHASDLVYFAALQNPKQHSQGMVTPGKKYSVKVLAVVVQLPDEVVEATIDDALFSLPDNQASK